MEAWNLCNGLLLVGFLVLGFYVFVSLAVRIPTDYPRTRAWRELARQTGLAYDPGSPLWYLLFRHPPRLSGSYRDHFAAVARVVQFTSEGPYVCTQVSVQVGNHGDSSLSLQPRRLLQRAGVPIGDLRFERSFTLAGDPPRFLRSAIELVLTAPPGLVAWLLRTRPSITLNGSNLTCRPDAPRDVQTQIALLDLLCAIAHLAEGISRETAARM